MKHAWFAVTTAAADRPALVVASGDIDLANVEEFRTAMTKACNGSDTLTIDLTEVSYCDSTAVGALFSVAATTALTLLIRPTGNIKTLLRISGLDRVATVVTKD
ncbi:MAG: STAS domain-containing protein [Mycobacterium sp.]|nr:STAS domain-containing protein [Mycobacterium sp.]